MAGESRTQDNVNKSRTVLDIPGQLEPMSLETLAALIMASLTPTMLYGTAPCTMPLSFSFHFFFFFFFKVHIKQTSKKHLRQLLSMVKHLRTDGPQPIVLTSDADSQRLAAGGRPGADGVRITDG